MAEPTPPAEPEVLWAFDRKVVVATLPPDASIYEMMRAWVHNHPERGDPKSIRPVSKSSFRHASPAGPV